MAERLSDEDANHIISLQKSIIETIRWEEAEGSVKFKVRLENVENYPAYLIGTYNHRTKTYSFTIIAGNERVRGLDYGKTNHNPDCSNVRNHKHIWCEQNKDRMAYEPIDIDFSTMESAFQTFLTACNIQYKGMLPRPYLQARLIQYEL